MREIKFRIMTDSGYEYSHEVNCCVWSGLICARESEQEQYTGLKDKNSVEIYEGDILDFDEKEWGEPFEPEEISMEHMAGNWFLSGTVEDVSQWRQVIGNIHQNPELLK